MAEHRVSLLRSALRRRVDPARSRDPRVQAVVGALASLPIAPPPDPAFRAELRAQLVAIAPRIVAESAPPAPAAATAAHDRRDREDRPDEAPSARRRFSLGRPLAVTASLVAVLALLLGGAVWMSRKALPGDTLYGLKRASESLQLATAGSDREKAQDYLDFAATRAAEVRDLLAARQTSQIPATLDAGDTDVTAAARLLNGEAARNGLAGTAGHHERLGPQSARAAACPGPGHAGRRPAGPHRRLVRPRAAALQRSHALAGTLHCACLAGARTDKLGPVPCSPCAQPAVTSPSGPGKGGSGTTGTTRRKAPAGSTGGKRGGQSPDTPRGGAVSTTPGAGGATPTPGVPKLPIKLPQPSRPRFPA